ncbi:hypothetical protein EDD16DRAFT_287411 [Pisolithus croceorrhizus]|nr:hypothetical protein EDD16DRAFT_287411 [Pisolithus croceorrhizus]
MSHDSLDSFETCIQDPGPDEHGELPMYDDVVAQSPNSRFGRWRGWIEKRAAERYAEVSTEELERRRTRGWGDGLEQQPEQVDTTVGESSASQSQSRVHPLQPPLRIRVDDDVFSASPSSAAHAQETSISNQESLAYTPTAASFVTLPQCQTTSSETLLPTHLQVHHFGSRFLPHTTSPIHCVLPLQRDRLLFIGTDKGLSVMDMYPVEWANGVDGNIGIVQKGPSEAQARAIWTGEAVYQLSILEYEDIGEGTPQGVVLALVGPDPDAPSASNGHQESLRSLRMYNLASLMSLARWIITQQTPNPVDLRRASDWNVQQTPVKKHRSASSITRGLKNLIIESPPRTQQVATTSYESYLSAQSPKRQGTTTPADSSWDVVEDLPLRWATDFVPLASPTSRLASMSAIAYALWQEGGPGPGGGRHGRRTLLAVATKYNIFLYETPKGERAFRPVKEFYTPIQARNLTFVQQSVQDVSRSQSDASCLRVGGSGNGHARVPSSEGPFSSHNNRQSMVTPATFTYSAQMAIFVIFDKKASIIRIADAAVTEVEMFDGNCNSPTGGKDQLSIGSSVGTRRSRASIDFMALREGKGTWALPILIGIPPAQAPSGAPHSIYILSRGKQTHVVSAPLPKSVQATPPLYSITWNSNPTSITCRLCLPSPRRSVRSSRTPSFLQLLGLGEQGIEVHEISLAALSHRKGKDKEGTPTEATHVRSFIGETGFLATGGHWHQLESVVAPQLERTDSATSASSYGSVESEEVRLQMRAAAGLYCSLRKDVEDWRVFWVGGDAKNVGEYDEDEDGLLV